MTSLEFRRNTLFLRNQFESDGNLDIPIIRSQYVDLSNVELIGYDKTKLNDSANSNSYVHFSLDDYKFQAIWNAPEPRVEKLRQYNGVLSPQFSTYYTMPTAL